MQAVIMAGGEGSRLRPLTLTRPKPMVPLVNQPVLGHILDLLKRHGVTEVTITLQYLSDVIRDYFGDGSEFGMHITYSVEDVPLGTAGSVKLAAQRLSRGEPFLVISGDAVTDVNLHDIFAYHDRKEALATVTLARVANPLEYGVVITDEDGRIIRFIEKPGWADVVSDFVNTGIYVLEPEVLNNVDEGQVFDFSHDLFPLMIEEGEPPYGYVASGYWTDVGNAQEYMRATADVLYGKAEVASLGTHIGGDIYCAGEYEIAPDASLYGPIYLGHGVKIKGGVVIHGPTVLRDNVVVDTRSKVERSVIWRNSYIGERAEIRGAIVARHCSIKARVMIFEGTVVADNTIINENAVIQPNVKIWPDKEVEAGATVSSSIIWGARGRRTLFGRYGVTGLVNVDLTPEFAARLGAAYGATLPRGSSVTVNREAHNTPRVIKRAVLSGLPSSGVNVIDIRTQPIPVARYYTAYSGAQGGVHVRLSPYDNRVVDVKFFQGRGLDLGRRAQRNVENVFFREDFRRAYLDEIGRIGYAPDVEELYSQRFLDSLEREQWPLPVEYSQIVIDYANAVTTRVLPDLLSTLGVDVVAVNADLDERKLFRTSDEFEEGMHRLASITRALESNFGGRLDVGGEKVYIAVNDGTIVPNVESFLAVAMLVLTVWPGSTIGVPVTAPYAVERLAERFGGQVRRLKTDHQAHMQAALSGDLALVGDTKGGFIFPAFIPFFDAMFAIVKIIELSAMAERRLGDVVKGLPSYYMAEARVPCRWEAKGRIMRQLAERYRDEHAPETPEGIRIDLGDEWVLLLPDQEEPSIHVLAEGVNRQGAQDLVDKYSSLISGLLMEADI